LSKAANTAMTAQLTTVLQRNESAFFVEFERLSASVEHDRYVAEIQKKSELEPHSEFRIAV
jgi:hypothetical protein